MASNAKFEIEIYGNTAKFENSLKGINTAMSGLKGEAGALKKALALDPTNTDKMQQLQKNLQQQLKISKDRATQLKKELSEVDKSTPEGQKKWVKLQRDLANTTVQADKLEADIKDVDNAIKNGKWETKAKIDLDSSGVDSKINGFKSKFNGLKEIAVGAFRQIGSSAVSALGNGLKGWVSDAMATQKSMIALKNTMQFKGNANEFQMVSRSMQKLATDTNANTEDTMKLATTFIGLGDSAGTAVSKTQALVKANQAFGGSGEQLKGVVLAYGQMSAAGKVSAENIGQLTDNNTALGASLKDTIMKMNPTLKQYGSFNEAVSKGAVSMDMLDKAMQKMADGSGGGVTTIGDAWDSFNETMSTALLPTLEALTPVITALIDKMQGWGEIAGNAISEIVRYVQFLWEAISDSGALDFLSGGFKALGSTIGSIVDIIKNVLVSFGLLPEKAITADNSIEAIAESILQLSGHFEAIMIKISNFVKKISESETAMTVLKGAIVVLASAFAAFKVAKGILAIINAFKAMKAIVSIVISSIKILYATIMANPFVAIAVAIAAVVAGLVYFFTQTKTGQKVWQSFVEFLQQSIENIKQFFAGLGTWFVELWNGIVTNTQTIWNNVTTFFGTIVEGIKSFFTGIGEFFTTLWTNIITTTQTIWNNILSFFSTVVQGIMNFFRPLINFYQSLWNLIFSIINLVLQLILTGVRGVVQGIQNLFKAMGNFVNSVWQNILNFFTPIINTIRSSVQSVTSAIGSFFNQAWSTVSGVWGQVAGWFSSKFDAVKNAVSNVFNTFGQFARSSWSAVSGVFNSVGSWFGNVFNSAREAVSNAFNAFGNIAQGAWNAITNAFSGVYDFFANAFGGVKDLIDSVLGGVTNTINNISSAINGVSKTVSGMFKGSRVQALSQLNVQAAGSGALTQYSASNDNRSYNTFNINAGNQDATALARAVRREFEQGRA